MAGATTQRRSARRSLSRASKHQIAVPPLCKRRLGPRLLQVAARRVLVRTVFCALVVVGMLVANGSVAGQIGGSSPAVCEAGLPASPTSVDSFVAVPNSSNPTGAAGDVETFDSTTSSLIGQPVPVGKDPVALAVDPTNSDVYVADKTDNTVDVVNYLADELLTSIALPSGSAPDAVAVSPGGPYVVVGDSGTDKLSVISTVSNTLVSGQVSLTGSPKAFAFEPDGRTLFVAEPGNDGIDILVSSSGAPYYSWSAFQSGPNANSFAITGDGSTLYVADTANNQVDVYAAGDGSLSLTTSWSISQPFYLALGNAEHTLYVTNPAYENGSTHVFYEIDTSNGSYASYDIPHNDQVGEVAMNGDGSILTMASTTEPDADRWEVDINTAQNDVSSLLGSPSAIATSPDDDLRFYAYVAQSGTNTVEVVDLSTNGKIASIGVGSNPEMLASSPDGSAVYVANTGTGSNGSVGKITTADIGTSTNPYSAMSLSMLAGALPDAMAVSPSGDQLLIADYDHGVVYDVELNNSDTMTTIDLNGSGTSTYEPVAIAISPAGNYAYVTDNGWT